MIILFALENHVLGDVFFNVTFLGDVKGDILVNGKQISKELMLRVTGFVPQKDLCLESLTVMEHLHFMVSSRKFTMYSTFGRVQIRVDQKRSLHQFHRSCADNIFPKR